RASLTRRVNRRMQDAGASDYATYRELLEAQPDEFIALFNTILINVTEFLRDPEAWRHLTLRVLPHLIASKGEEDAIRVWSAGCASGEEAYTLAVLLCDAVGEERFKERVKIYGTDADNEALTEARHARYASRAVREAFTDEQVERYWTAEDDSLIFRSDLRRSVIFGRHDLVRDPPISRVDLLVCRNTLMYFNLEIQRKILADFHFALNEGGYLFLGKSEALVTRTPLFRPEDVHHHVFVKAGNSHGARPPIQVPPGLAREARPKASPTLTEVAFDAIPLAQLVVDPDGALVMANRHARSLFGLGLNHIGRPFRDLQVSYRPAELRSAIEAVMAERRPQNLSEVELELPGGGSEYLDIQLVPLLTDHEISGVSLTFAQVGRYKVLREELEQSQRELETAYEELQSTVEELETTNEELQSTNEELETTNEELHSTNEELETMNEELQSTNEELETINTALRERTIELDELSSFLQAILSSLRSGVVVLGQDMNVRVWNRQAEDLWGLRASEVQGQHFLSLDIGLPVNELREPIRACLAGLSSGERSELGAVNRRGREITCQVAVLPLNGSDRQVEGTILLMDVLERSGDH
ncbi:MAG TPA: CheR family methyltransferase, partial [Acidimicrobiales bacterium]|nr:CheR family methyltransferase [Acidimicrobiales bacterium]